MNIKEIVSLLAIVIICASCSGGYLFDSSSQDSSDFAQEFEEGRREVEIYQQKRKDDPCLDDKLSGVPPELQRCGNWQDNKPQNDVEEYF